MALTDRTIRVSGDTYHRLRQLADMHPALSGGSIGGVVAVLSLASAEDAAAILRREAMESYRGPASPEDAA